jgi:hypothetical protein
MINVGNPDRAIRALAGVVLMALPFITSFAMWANPLLKWGVPTVGLVLLLTAIFSFCPLYRVIGASTTRLKR